MNKHVKKYIEEVARRLPNVTVSGATLIKQVIGSSLINKGITQLKTIATTKGKGGDSTTIETTESVIPDKYYSVTADDYTDYHTDNLIKEYRKAGTTGVEAYINLINEKSRS